MALLQPRISDWCGALGLGHRPTRTERIAWESRAPGSCAALRVHVERFPEGAYRAVAADRIAARRVTHTETWEPATRRLVLFVGEGDVAYRDEPAAHAAALGRAQVTAERLCKGFAATASYRLTSAKPTVQTWNCSRASGGVRCGLEGEAVCEVEERRVQEVEVCEG
jgi:hypothetical protein